MSSLAKMYTLTQLDDIVNKYNNTYHSTIKMKPIEVKASTYIGFNKKIMRKILNLKIAILLEYQNVNIFLQKVMFQIDLKKCM